MTGDRTPESQAVAILEDERRRICLLTRRGIGMPMAGFLFWIAMAVFVRTLPERAAMVYSFFATGAVFPLGILFTRLAGGDLFVKSARSAKTNTRPSPSENTM